MRILTLLTGHEVNHDIHGERGVRSGSKGSRELYEVEHLVRSERQGELTRGRLDVACVHRRAVALRKLDRLVSETTDTEDQNSFRRTRGELDD